MLIIFAFGVQLKYIVLCDLTLLMLRVPYFLCYQEVQHEFIWIYLIPNCPAKEYTDNMYFWNTIEVHCFYIKCPLLSIMGFTHVFST